MPSAWQVVRDFFPFLGPGQSGLRKLAVGEWRRPEMDPMQVVSGPIGRETVHFEAPEGLRVPKEMETFLTWFNAPPREDP